MSLSRESPKVPSSYLVPFIFGVSGLDAIPGTALSTLLCDLGLSEAGARTVIARLRQRGGLVSHRTGRRTVYRLAGPAKDLFDRTREGTVVPPWRGYYHSVVYWVPEPIRDFRAQLRWQAARVGFAPLRSGLLVCPEDRWAEVVRLLGRIPARARILTGRFAMELDAARTAADIAWGLSELGRRYHREITRFANAASSLPDAEPDATTLRRFYRIQQSSFRLLREDAHLPSELLPGDWPRAQMWAERADFYRTWGAAVVRYVDEVIERTETTDLVVRLPVRRWVDTEGFAQLSGAGQTELAVPTSTR